MLMGINAASKSYAIRQISLLFLPSDSTDSPKLLVISIMWLCDFWLWYIVVIFQMPEVSKVCKTFSIRGLCRVAFKCQVLVLLIWWHWVDWLCLLSLPAERNLLPVSLVPAMPMAPYLNKRNDRQYSTYGDLSFLSTTNFYSPTLVCT